MALVNSIGTVLAQSMPTNTTAASVYSPAAGVVAEITRALVVNTSAGNHKFRIFIDNDGTTYDETTALFWDETLNADTTREISGSWWVNDKGNLAVRSDTASAITFTFFGAEYYT